MLKLVFGYRLEGLAHKVLQWYLCRMEGWFAADADTISLKSWDQASFWFITKFELQLIDEFIINQEYWISELYVVSYAKLTILLC